MTKISLGERIAATLLTFVTIGSVVVLIHTLVTGESFGMTVHYKAAEIEGVEQ